MKMYTLYAQRLSERSPMCVACVCVSESEFWVVKRLREEYTEKYGPIQILEEKPKVTYDSFADECVSV